MSTFELAVQKTLRLATGLLSACWLVGCGANPLTVQRSTHTQQVEVPPPLKTIPWQIHLWLADAAHPTMALSESLDIRLTSVPDSVNFSTDATGLSLSSKSIPNYNQNAFGSLILNGRTDCPLNVLFRFYSETVTSDSGTFQRMAVGHSLSAFSSESQAFEHYTLDFTTSDSVATPPIDVCGMKIVAHATRTATGDPQ